VLFYTTAEATAGLATGVLVQDGEADGAQALWDNFLTDDLFFGLGALAWVVATIAAAFAYRRAGAPMGAVVLLGLSALVAWHAPPIGSIGLVLFAAAAFLLVRSREAAPAATPALADQG
jgi:hypothetical protein